MEKKRSMASSTRRDDHDATTRRGSATPPLAVDFARAPLTAIPRRVPRPRPGVCFLVRAAIRCDSRVVFHLLARTLVRARTLAPRARARGGVHARARGAVGALGDLGDRRGSWHARGGAHLGRAPRPGRAGERQLLVVIKRRPTNHALAARGGRVLSCPLSRRAPQPGDHVRARGERLASARARATLHRGTGEEAPRVPFSILVLVMFCFVRAWPVGGVDERAM